MTRRVGVLGAPLTDHELRLLRLAADGLTDQQIGRETSYATDSTKQFMRTLYEKLGARNRAHAVHLGHQAGHLEREPAG